MTEQAILSSQMVDSSIAVKDMTVGESRFTGTWALQADTSSHLWINKEYPAHLQADRTRCVEVTRLNDGFSVNVSACSVDDLKYRPGEAKNLDVELPVVKLEGAP
jgi:hypothetical protein